MSDKPTRKEFWVQWVDHESMLRDVPAIAAEKGDSEQAIRDNILDYCPSENYRQILKFPDVEEATQWAKRNYTKDLFCSPRVSIVEVTDFTWSTPTNHEEVEAWYVENEGTELYPIDLEESSYD